MAKKTKLAGGANKARRHLAYPTLSAWPALPAPVAVHLDMATGQAGLRVPVKLMRKCGMHPERGVNVAIFEDRVIIRGDELGGAYRQAEHSKQLCLATSGISAAVASGNFAVVEGPDYLVLTTKAEALKMAGAAPVLERTPAHRIDNVPVPRFQADLDVAGLEILGWKDVNTINCVRGRKSRVAGVSGHLWWLAGFQCGDPLRFTRFGNSTVVEKCTPNEKHSTLGRSSGRDIPRHYFGAALLGTEGAERVRVIATPGKLIVTLLDTDVSARCTEATHQPSPPQPVAPVEPPEPLPVLDAASVVAVREKNYTVKDGRVVVTGDIWAKAGFRAQHPARLVRYANALAVEACDEAVMEFRVGTPSQPRPYRSLGLAKTGLAGAAQVKVVAAEGRLIVALPNLSFGRAPVAMKPAPERAPLTNFDRTGLATLTTKLCTVRSGGVRLGGPVCSPAGFTARQPVRVVPYADAVVVEACADADMQLRVRYSDCLPYVTVDLRDTVLADESRVQAYAGNGRIVVLKPTGGPGTFVVQDAAPATASMPFDSSELALPTARRCQVKAGRITLRGKLMAAAGLIANDPVRVRQYADALVIEACPEADMNFRLRRENGGLPVASVALAGTPLAEERHVLALAVKGRIVLAALDDGPLAERRMTEHAQAATPDSASPAEATPAPAPAPTEEPCHQVAVLSLDAASIQALEASAQRLEKEGARAFSKAEIAEVFTAVGQDTQTASACPPVEVRRYQVPAGKRLQMQGAWLNQFGFLAGAKYGVRADAGKVCVELGGEATWTVTNYSATASKLYVPAAILAALGAGEVTVLARNGLLELVPSA